MPNKQFERFLVRRPCVAHIRAMIELKQLNRYPFIYWQCSPDHERVTQAVARNLKFDGYEKGCFDMIVIGASGEVLKTWLIEFKWGKNDYTNEQKYVANMSVGTPVECLKIYSRDEFIDFVDRELR